MSYKLGVTGGIGSGKSTVCKFFEIFDIPVYHADARAKWLIENDKDLIGSIIEYFGDDSYRGGIYNSTYISSKVFGNPESLQQLNSLIHPVVQKDYLKWVDSRSHFSLVLKEAAIMQKAQNQEGIDAVLYIYAPVETRLKRVSQRDPQRSIAQIKNIMDKQRSEESYRAIADFVITNDDKKLISPQALSLLQSLPFELKP